MNKVIISFIISALIGLGLGYFVFDVLPVQPEHDPEVVANENMSGTTDTASSKDTNDQNSGTQETEKTTSADADNVLSQKGCLGCHSVGSLNLTGGQVGPDLSDAFASVEEKHGKPIEEFLKEPTSAVMSGVIGSNPLTDDERKQVLELLKKASEAK